MMMQQDARPIASRSGLDRLVMDLLASNNGQAGDVGQAGNNGQAGGDGAGLPPDIRLPRHGTVVLFSDFLSPLADIQTLMARFAAVPVTGYLLQILDPAETDLPYQGRIRFRGTERDGEAMIPRAESVRDAYAERLKAQQDGLARMCATAGFGFGVHRTDHAPEMALLTLYQALAAR